MAKTEEEVETKQKAALCSYKRADNKSCHNNAESGKEYCILHDPNLSKDKQRFDAVFEQEIKRQRGGKTLDIEGFVFVKLFDFNEIKWLELEAIHAYKAKFSNNVQFADVTFSGEVDFAGARFSKHAHFVGATFSEHANFMEATFKNQAYFARTTFSKPANFGQATFSKKASFVETTFSDEVYFGRVLFYENTDFTGATFSEETDFGRARFYEGACFRKTKFLSRTSFEYAIANSCLFEETEFSGETRFTNVDLSNVEFRNAGGLWHCLFANTLGLEECKFSHIRWEDPKSKKRDWILADQKKLADNESVDRIRTVETAYRELKVNYEKHKNFPDAGHFYYGEMEMIRRRGSLGPHKFKKISRFLLFLYWLISGYGERVWRSMAAFAVVLFFFTGIYYSFINQNLLKSFVLSARAALLRSDVFSTTSSDWIHLAMISEMILGPLTLGLFALAVRRQFKRN